MPGSTVQRRRVARKAELLKLKDAPCACCGERFPPDTMCFDQVRDMDKGFRMSLHANHSWELVLLQISRCEVVCRACLVARMKFRYRLSSGRSYVLKAENPREERALDQEMKRWNGT